MASEHLRRRRLARLNAAKPVGYVYFVGAEEVCRVKIGFSFHDPDERFKPLETGSPVKLSKLGLMRGEFRREAELHRRFAKYRARLEWFHLVPEISDFIAAEARNWEELIAEEKAARDAKGTMESERRHAEMQAVYRAARWPTSEDYMAGRT